MNASRAQMKRCTQHKLPDYCVCNSQALAPDEQCPIHGVGEWPPRCMYCGTFMKWPGEQGKESDK